MKKQTKIKKFLKNWRKYKKAIIGALTPPATVILVALQSGTPITRSVLLTALLTAIVGGGSVYQVKNKES